MEPLPPAGSPSRRGTPPPPLGPSSGSAFPADGDDDAAASRPCFTLDEWWLVNVEGDDHKIAVAGTFERNHITQEYFPAPIAKRLESNVLETEDGTILNIHGPHNVSHTFRNGYSKTVCEKFLHGFPDWWQCCKLLYPKLTNTDTEDTDSTQFYLDQFELGKRFHLEGTYWLRKCDGIFKNFSHNDAVFQKSSHLLNGKPRFEECTCDGDILTDENPAASSKAATCDQRTPAASLEVRVCCKETEHMSLTEKAAVDDEMPTSVYLDMQNSLCLSNGTPVLEAHTCNGDIPTNEDAAASNDDNGKYTAKSKEVNNMEIGLVTPSRERGHDDIATNVSLALAVECTNNAVSESVHSTPATGTYRKRTPVASLKRQVSWRQNQHIASNKKPVDWPQKQISPQEKCQTATRFPVNRNSVLYAHRSPPTRGKDYWSITSVEDLKLKRSRSGRMLVPKLDEGYQSLVYGMDGSITGVIGLDSPGMFKWSESKTSRRKKRTE